MNTTISETKTPSLKVSKKGNTFKILEVTAETDAVMPPHLSTKEAVVIVQEGDAVLEINGTTNHLTQNDVFVVPAATAHTLSIKSKFKAVVIMELDSQIEFVN